MGPFLSLLPVFFKDEPPASALGTASGSDGPQGWLTLKDLCLPPSPSTHLAVRTVTADLSFVTGLVEEGPGSYGVCLELSPRVDLEFGFWLLATMLMESLSRWRLSRRC